MADFDPPPPPGSSPPPPPPPVPPPPAQTPGGFGPPPPAGPPTTFAPVTPPPKQGPNKGLLIGIGAAVVAAIVAVIIIATGGDDKKTATTVPDVSLPGFTLPDITIPDGTIPDIPSSDGTIVAATDGTTFTGPSGWTMQVPDSWQEVPDASSRGAEAAWFTGGSDSSFNSNVNIVTTTEGLSLGLKKFLDANLPAIESQLPGAEIVDTKVITTDTGGQYARAQYRYHLAQINKPVGGLLVITKTSTEWLVCTFSVLDANFDAEVGSVEPYMATLGGS